MAVYGPVTALKATISLLLNFVCRFVLPIIEKVASTLRFGCEVKGPAPAPVAPPEEHGKRKKRKGTNAASSAPGAHGSQNGVNGKWLKLLVNVTVRQVKDGSSKHGVEVEESSSYVIEDDPNTNGFGHRVCKEPGIITWIINFPSSIVLAMSAKLREWAHKLDPSQSGEDGGRVMRSPRRRINKSDYRKIIPFFPYNLLGFSNYTPFQMPNFTSPEKSQSLNTPNREKPRHKRQRQPSTESSTSSDDDFSHLEAFDINGQRVDIEGCDVVDSDVSSDAKITAPTEPLTSSSPASNNGKAEQSATTSFKVTSNNGKTTLEKEEAGDEVEVISTFYQELDEAANESYNSQDDPDYQPPFTPSEESSFVSGETGDSDSFLQSGPTPDDSINVQNAPEEKAEEHGSGRAEEKRPESLLTDEEELKNPTPCEDDYKTPNEEDEQEDKRFGRAQY